MTKGGMQVLFVFTSVPHSRKNDFSDYVFSFRLSRGKHVPPEVLILNVYDKLKEILSDGILVLIVTNTSTVRYRPTPARHPSFCESHGDETSPKSLHRLHEAFLWRIVWKETAANGWHSGQNIPYLLSFNLFSLTCINDSTISYAYVITITKSGEWCNMFLYNSTPMRWSTEERLVVRLQQDTLYYSRKQKTSFWPLTPEDREVEERREAGGSISDRSSYLKLRAAERWQKEALYWVQPQTNHLLWDLIVRENSFPGR